MYKRLDLAKFKIRLKGICAKLVKLTVWMDYAKQVTHDLDHVQVRRKIYENDDDFYILLWAKKWLIFLQIPYLWRKRRKTYITPTHRIFTFYVRRKSHSRKYFSNLLKIKSIFFYLYQNFDKIVISYNFFKDSYKCGKLYFPHFLFWKLVFLSFGKIFFANF